MTAINEITICKSWIAHELAADTQIQNLVGDSFYAGVADADAGDFYIVFSYVSGRLTKKLGMRRKLVRLLFDIKIYQRGTGNADFTNLINRVEEMFGYFINRQWNGWNFSSEMETPLDLPESEKENNVIWQGSGATYQISAYEL